MAKNIIPTLCYYDGELVVDDQKNGKYVGGLCKPGRVRKGCNLTELKESVYKTTRINREEFEIELVVNWPTDSGSKAIALTDDDDVEVMFSAVSKSIELYVGKVARPRIEHQLPSPVVSSGVGYYTEMLNTAAPMDGYVSPSFSNPYVNTGSYYIPPMQYGFEPYTNSQPPTQQSCSYFTLPTDAFLSQR